MAYLPQGTHASYQGVPCDSVRFVRRRGITADVTTVTIPAGRWQDLVLEDLSRAQLAKRPTLEIPEDLPLAFQGDVASGAPVELPSKLQGEGTLVMAENAEHVVSVPGLVVTRVETDQIGEDGSGFVRLTLVDERFFWARGILQRFSFNQLRLDGTVRKDTLKEEPEGERWTLGEVFEQHVLPSMWRKPSAGWVTASVANTSREVGFPYLGRASLALQALAELGGATEPCLSLEGQVSLYAPGEGFLGHAVKGEPVNTQKIPEEFYADEEGRGRHYVIEKNFPEECFVFVGQERVATVAVDGWEPVIMIDGRPAFLSEELVNDLTKGARGGPKGLAWLQKFVLLPSPDRGVRGVDDRVLKLFSEEAYRLWRLPGVETVGEVSAEDLEAAAQLPESDPARQALEAKGRAGYYTGNPGQNAHLLPLLDRAETAGGRRAPVTVEAYSFEPKRRKFETTAVDQALFDVRRVQQEIRTAAATLASARGESNVFGIANPAAYSDVISNFSGLSLRDFVDGAPLPTFVDRERVESYMRELRRAELLKAQSSDLAQRYERTLAEEAKALTEGGASPGAEAEFELARKLINLERQAAEGAKGVSIKEQLKRESGRQAAEAIRQAGEKVRRATEEANANTAAGLAPKQLQGGVFLQPKPRTADSGARVVSAELGIVRTSFLAGHPREPEVHIPSMTSLQPLPVRVLFGATLRPQIDRPQPKPSGRPTTGTGLQDFVHKTLAAFYQGPFKLDHVIPKALSERAAFYVSAWTRTAAGKVEPTSLEQVPWDRASKVVVRWRELVPLSGQSNKADLDEQARRAAVERSKTPDTTRSENLTLVGPWPVQCDGLISRVEIRMERVSEAPCGFTTEVTIGGDGSTNPTATRTRTRS